MTAYFEYDFYQLDELDHPTFDFVADLAQFLMEGGNISSLEEVWNLQFDTGIIEYGVDGLAALEPNGMTTYPIRGIKI